MTGINGKEPITPETKVGALLAAYPELEKTFIRLAPEFKKLRNPVLKRTIARVTSLRQAAAIAKLSVAEMINSLRSAADIDERFEDGAPGAPEKEPKPGWLSMAGIVRTYDAGPELESGGQPILRVLKECQGLKPGEIYELITPFLPAPLLEKVKGKGYEVWWEESEEGVFRSYFTPVIRSE